MKLLNILLLVVFLEAFILPVQAEKQPKLRIVAAEHQLLQYREGEQLKGSTIEILKQVLLRAHIDTDVEFMPWARAYNIVKNRPNTMVLSMVRNSERENNFYWLGKVSELARVFISLSSKPENYIENNNQALLKTVAVTRNSNSHKALLQQGFVEGKNLYIVASPQQAFNLLLNGKVDLIYHDPNVILNYLRQQNRDSSVISYKKITPDNHYDSYIALNKNSDTKLIKKLTLAMKAFAKTKRYQELIH